MRDQTLDVVSDLLDLFNEAEPTGETTEYAEQYLAVVEDTDLLRRLRELETDLLIGEGH